MLLYGDIVKKALEQEALPILKEVVDTALTDRFGAEWYAYFARAIMEGYADFKKIDTFVAGQKGSPIDAFDISALCYLVMPYDKDLKMYLDGAMPMIEDKFGLERNPERMKRLRTIQNNVYRNKTDADMDENEATALFGAQEKKWLLDIEKTLKEFRPEFTLADCFKQLDELVGQNVAKKEQEKAELAKRPSHQEVRDSYTKTWKFEFTDAPVGHPLVGSAPWIVLNEDLDKLPWPSAVGKEEPAQPQTDAAAGEAVWAGQEMAQTMPRNEEMAAAGKPQDAAQVIAQAVMAGELNPDEFVKPDPTGEPVRKIPGTAPNESPAEEAADQKAEAESKKTKGGLFGWFKGKK